MRLINFQDKDKWISMIESRFPSMIKPAKFMADGDGTVVAKEIPYKRFIEIGLLVRKKGKYYLGFPE